MEQNGFVKNISGTVCVIGIALSTISVNSTMIVNGDYKAPKANYSEYNENSSNQYNVATSNIYYEQKSTTRLGNEITALVGTMRDATQEEQASVNKYIKSISKDIETDLLNYSDNVDFIQERRGTNVFLEVKKISKHVTSIDLEEVYEEI